MIDAIQNDFAVWKKASQVRELCEERETKLKLVRNLWIGAILFAVIALNVVKLLLPKISSTEFSISAISGLDPIIKWFGAAILVALILAVIVFCIRYNSAANKTELARKNEWHSLLMTYRNFYKKCR